MKPGTDALRALLTGSVDYAGLFPPAGLALAPALESYATYICSDDAWLLGCFVLPAAKLAEAGSIVNRQFWVDYPFRISALGMKANSAEEFLENLRNSIQELADFGQTHGPELAGYQFEAPLPPGTISASEFSALFRRAAEIIQSVLPCALQVFWEVPVAEASPKTLENFAEHNARGFRPFGLKLRTGGTDAAAFPNSRQLAGALIAARDAGVTVKFTAGLHHPIRHFNEELRMRMHGFLNVFAAGILARELRLDAAEVQAILEDEQPNSFQFDGDGFAWRDRHVSVAALTAHRQYVTSFGSCSFDEPRDDLRQLGLMP